MNESDIIMLINYLHALPQRVDPGHSGFASRRHDEYRAIFTDAQRNFVIEALRRIPALTGNERDSEPEKRT